MLYNLQNPFESNRFDVKCEFLKSRGKTVDLIEKMNTRTTRQNSALHLYFTMICNELNELGMEFHYFGLKGQALTTRYTNEIVKNRIWREIQMTMFDIKSTKKINTIQINEIIDVITKWFAEKSVVIQFPSIESLTNNKI